MMFKTPSTRKKRGKIRLVGTISREVMRAREDAAEMFLVVAVGTAQSGDSSAELYRSRLRAISDVLLVGLKQT